MQGMEVTITLLPPTLMLTRAEGQSTLPPRSHVQIVAQGTQFRQIANLHHDSLTDHSQSVLDSKTLTTEGLQ